MKEEEQTHIQNGKHTTSEFLEFFFHWALKMSQSDVLITYKTVNQQVEPNCGITVQCLKALAQNHPKMYHVFAKSKNVSIMSLEYMVCYSH